MIPSEFHFYDKFPNSSLGEMGKYYYLLALKKEVRRLDVCDPKRAIVENLIEELKNSEIDLVRLNVERCLEN